MTKKRMRMSFVAGAALMLVCIGPSAPAIAQDCSKFEESKNDALEALNMLDEALSVFKMWNQAPHHDANVCGPAALVKEQAGAAAALASPRCDTTHAAKDALNKMLNGANTQIALFCENDVMIYRGRGEAHFRRGEHDRAVADFSEAIRLDPRNADIFAQRADAYVGTGQDDRAFVDLSEAIRLNPKFADALTKRGGIYQSKDDYDRAIADYSEAIRVDPNAANAYISRGEIYRRKGNYDAAIGDFTRAIRILPITHPYSARGLAYLAKGDFDHAIADFTEVLRKYPNDTEALENRAAAHQAKGEYESAIDDYSKFIAQHPPFADSVFNGRGEAYLKLGQYERAIADFDAAIRLNRNNEAAIKNRAVAIEKSKPSGK